jgi:hypothetical protein
MAYTFALSLTFFIEIKMSISYYCCFDGLGILYVKLLEYVFEIPIEITKMMRTSLLSIQCKDRSLEHVCDSWISRYVLTL